MQKKESQALRFLYHTPVGRMLLVPLCSPALSKICGAYLDSPASLRLVKGFAEKHGINLADYECDDLHSFNEFFTRKIKAGKRPINHDPSALIAPCDGLLSAYRIHEGSVIPVKQSQYTIPDLLGGDPIAARYQNGICLVFRLCVDHYHRYAYVDSGIKRENHFLPGVLHTVRPIALAECPVFTQNSREYTVIESENFGNVVQMEVGAMLVGKIRNHHGAGRVTRGAEKGMFLYGGSTVIVLLEPGRARLPKRLFEATERGIETPVRLGQKIGCRGKR